MIESTGSLSPGIFHPNFLVMSFSGCTFFQVKEQLLVAICRAEHLPDQFSKLHLLPDLSKHTLQLRGNLLTITKALRNQKILHHWKYPSKLTITHNRVTKSWMKVCNFSEAGTSSLVPAPSCPRLNHSRQIPPHWQKTPQKKLPQHHPSGGS